MECAVTIAFAVGHVVRGFHRKLGSFATMDKVSTQGKKAACCSLAALHCIFDIASSSNVCSPEQGVIEAGITAVSACCLDNGRGLCGLTTMLPMRRNSAHQP